MKLRMLMGVLLMVTLLVSGVAALSPRGASASPEMAGLPVDLSAVSQFGITWTFDGEYECGQFANGDYWVVGPVTIVGITPPSQEVAGRVINGSMINPSPTDGSMQGYDSAMYAGYGPYYDAALNVARPNGQDLSASNPLVVQPGSSLVSAISLEEAGARPQLETAAVLTVLDAPPPEGSFRPPYSGSDKTLRFNVSQIDSALLRRLPPVASTPVMSDVERTFERPWIDHVPNWMADYHHPQENMPYYGRGMATEIGVGALVLHLDFSHAEKETLLIRYLQLGIDLYGVLQDGGEDNWVPNGGHDSGRKWPIMFAGLMLGDTAMQNVGPGDGTGDYYFGEDAQTFYVAQEDIDRVHDPDLRSCYLTEYEQSDLGLPEWGIRHATSPVEDNKAWCAIYRLCCTANAWDGFLLAALMMDAKELWAHDAIFDYQDRYMVTEEPGTWTRSWSDFAEEMWDTYRDDVDVILADLTLTGRGADRAIELTWTVSSTLPATSTWMINYEGPAGTAYLPIVGLPNATRAYTLTDLVNNAWYTVTLDAMLDGESFLRDSVRVMPLDPATLTHTVYLPLVLR